MRLYDYRCHVCGTERTQKAESDPGPILCGACRRTMEIRWWRTRPAVPFVPPDTTGVRFGPTLEELAEERRPFSRNRDDYEGMIVPLKAPEISRAVEQLSFFGSGGDDPPKGK